VSSYSSDPFTVDRNGRVRGAAPEPVHEYEESGRFRADPDASPDPAELTALLGRLGMLDADGNPKPKDLHEGNPIVDQWDKHREFAECFSPGHERLRNPSTESAHLGLLLAYARIGHRRRGGLRRGDIEQQIDDRFDKRPVLVGCDELGWLDVPVTSYEEVKAAVVDRYAAPSKKDSWCGFCYRKRLPLDEIRVLLRGHGFRIFVTPACARCQAKLVKNANEIDVVLDWIDHPARTGSR
jgi:hypothetical protein